MHAPSLSGWMMATLIAGFAAVIALALVALILGKDALIALSIIVVLVVGVVTWFLDLL